MAGLSEVCNHVGAVLYKCMQEAPQECSSTSLPNKWLPATKTVKPVPLKNTDFRLSKVKKCISAIEPPKSIKSSANMVDNFTEI